MIKHNRAQDLKLRERNSVLCFFDYKCRFCKQKNHFANLKTTDSLVEIRLRGKLRLRLFNPHNGNVSEVQCRYEGDATYIKLFVPADRSVFIVGSSF